MPEPTKDAYQYERMLRQRIQQAQQGKSAPTSGAQYNANAPLPSNVGDDLRRSIQDLGLSIADEVGRSLAEAANETTNGLGKAANEISRSFTQAANDVRQSGARRAEAEDARRNAAYQRAANRQHKPAGADFEEGLSSLLSLLFKGGGAVVCASILLSIFVGTGFSGSFLVWGLIAFAVVSGGKNKKKNKNKAQTAYTQTPAQAAARPAYQSTAISPMHRRYQRYRAAMGSDQVVPISRLAEAVQRNEIYVKKDLSRMIRKGIIQDGYVDNQDNMFFVNAALYRELQRKQEAASRAATAPPEPEAENAPLLQQCEDFLMLLDQHIVATETEEEIQTQLRHMRSTTQSILDWVRSHPESASKLRKFSSYYMPTTLKLMRSFDDVKGQNSKVAEDIRRDIGGILTTLNTAFDNLLADLLNDTALDISTEISAMQTMLAQDGLAETYFTTKE